MTYTLYYKQGSCSMAVHALLNELGVSCNLIAYQDAQGALNADLKAINPRGNVPVIADGDFNQREGGAILSWLCDEHDSSGSFLPKSGHARAKALQWLMFANATLHPAYSRYFFLKNNGADDTLMEKAVSGIQTLWDELNEELKGQDYICGESFSVADILLTVIANWAPALGIPIVQKAHCKAMFEKVSSRPAFQAALKEEQVPYKALAA